MSGQDNSGLSPIKHLECTCQDRAADDCCGHCPQLPAGQGSLLVVVAKFESEPEGLPGTFEAANGRKGFRGRTLRVCVNSTRIWPLSYSG